MSFGGGTNFNSFTAKTFALAPSAVGAIILVQCICETQADFANAIGSSNVTWDPSPAVAHTNVGGTEVTTVFKGQASSTGSATVTITTAAGSPIIRGYWTEFSTTAGYSNVAIDTTGTVAQTGTAPPSLTPGHGAGELYWGFQFNASTGTAGSTSGYTYKVDTSGNVAMWNTSCTSSAQSPTIGGGGGNVGGAALLLYEASSPATVALTAPGVTLAAPLVTPSGGATVALTAPNVALAAPVVTPATGKAVALTTPNLALAAPLVTRSAGGTVALTTPGLALAAPLVTPSGGTVTVALTTPNIALAAPLVTPPAAPVPPFPDPRGQLGVRLELSAGGTWTDVTSDLDHGPMTIGRGHPDESTTVSPSTFGATLTNKAARYSPDNVMSDLWPHCVQNMPVRASIPAAANYLRLEADSNDRAFVNDTSSLHVTGSLELRMALQLSDWQGCVLATRRDNTTPSWQWLLNADGTLQFSWWDSGGTLRTITSDAPVPPVSGDFALRVTLSAATADVHFYTSDGIDGTWAQLGDGFNFGIVTTVAAGNAPLVVAWSNNVANSQLLGRVYECRLYNGIGGPIAADGVFSAQSAGAVTWADSAGNTWNLAGGAEISDRDYRFHGESSEWPQDEPEYNPDENNDTTVATDALVPLVGGGLLRRLSQRAPNVSSAMYRAVLAQTGSLAPVAYWPMEDSGGATQFGSAVGGPPMTWNGGPPSLAADSSFICSAPLPTLGGAALSGQVAPYAPTGTWAVRFLADIPTLPPGNEVLFQVNCTGGLAAYIIFVVDSDGTVALTAYDANVNVIADTGPVAWTGGIQQPLWWSIEAQPSGSHVQYSLVSLTPGASVAFSATATSSAAGSAGAVTYATPNPWGLAWTDTVIGHLQVQSALVSLFSLAGALAAHAGEPAGQRFARLCAENGIACRIRGNAADTIAMGVQQIATLTTLLQACADADQAYWTELRQVLGWGYVTRKALYGQPATATVSYLSDHLSMWTAAPARDDQVAVNDVTYSNDSGSSARLFAAPGQLIPGGRMSTAAPAAGGIGTYAQSYSVSVASDSQLPDLAGWRLHIGTVDQARLPGIMIDLASTDAAAIYSSVTALDLGDRLVISSPPRRLGFEPVTQLAQALTETLFYDTLTIGVAGVPELPYEVVRLDAGMHLAPLNGVVSSAVSTTAASWSVKADSTDSTQLWSTSAGDYPQDWTVDGERVTVTAVSGSSSPQTATVTRSVNGVVKSHSAGAAIGTWPPPAIGL